MRSLSFGKFQKFGYQQTKKKFSKGLAKYCTCNCTNSCPTLFTYFSCSSDTFSNGRGRNMEENEENGSQWGLL